MREFESNARADVGAGRPLDRDSCWLEREPRSGAPGAAINSRPTACWWLECSGVPVADGQLQQADALRWFSRELAAAAKAKAARPIRNA